MAQNDFLQFDSSDTNTLTQAEYLTDTQRINGCTTGIARSKLFNRALRQVSSMCAAIGSIINSNGGSAVEDQTTLIASLKNYLLGIGTGTALPATTGTISVTMDGGIKTITPSGNCTFNATGGFAGQRITFIITTSGTTSYTLTFGTNFKSVGTLATGTVTAKVFTVSFVYSGSAWVEEGRTTAM